MLIAAAAVRLGTELGEQEGGNVTKVPPPASALRGSAEKRGSGQDDYGDPRSYKRLTA
jgi:hypothetical protein